MYLGAEKAVCNKSEKIKPAPIFKLGDVVQNIHSGEVFSIGMIAKADYNDVYYGPMLKYGMRGEHLRDSMTSGYQLKKYVPETKKKA